MLYRAASESILLAEASKQTGKQTGEIRGNSRLRNVRTPYRSTICLLEPVVSTEYSTHCLLRVASLRFAAEGGVFCFSSQPCPVGR